MTADTWRSLGYICKKKVPTALKCPCVTNAVGASCFQVSTRGICRWAAHVVVIDCWSTTPPPLSAGTKQGEGDWDWGCAGREWGVWRLMAKKSGGASEHLLLWTAPAVWEDKEQNKPASCEQALGFFTVCFDFFLITLLCFFVGFFPLLYVATWLRFSWIISSSLWCWPLNYPPVMCVKHAAPLCVAACPRQAWVSSWSLIAGKTNGRPLRGPCFVLQ